MGVPTFVASLDGSLAYQSTTGSGTGTGAGALRYRDGHTVGRQAALVEEGTTNHLVNPSAENGTESFSQISPATRETSTNFAWDGNQSIRATFSGVDSRVPIPGTSGVSQPPAAAQGQAWTFSVYAHGSETPENVDLYLYERPSIAGADDSTAYATTNAWQRMWHTRTLTEANTTSVSGTFRNKTDGSGIVVYLDGAQLEQKDHPTTFCPEYNPDGSLKPGYAWTGTAHASASTRAAASITFPLAEAPDWVACRYSEDLGATWDVAYLTTLTADNLGTYSSVVHDGDELVITSDRALLIGPVMAGVGTLTAGQQTLLENADEWTLDTLQATLGQFLVLNTAGTNDDAPTIILP